MDTSRSPGTARTGDPASAVRPATATGHQPVAIVGLSCRLPGAADPAAFWRLLRDGECAVGRVPAGRETAGGHWGGFIDGADRFDAEFFGITPREAAVLDPQQRLMLELAWEAFEDARIAADRIRGSETGVFIGAMRDDYALLLGRAGRSAVNHHAMPGVSRGVIANRVSHFLGLGGPSLVIDAGQASSLVAVHTAMESLRRGESSLALAGGVNLNLAAETGLVAEEFGGLSPDGRSHTFDHRANGFVRGEGGVALVLRPLPDALAAGDRIYGVLRGGAVNNDGAAENLTTPSSQAQAQVLRQAYASAGVRPDAVQYVELHGTGTPVGDPVEAAALGTVLGRARDTADPLLVGSAKTNVGHLEAAAGGVGLLKTVLALHHGRIPASLHFERPNPEIPLTELNLRVAADPVEWPAGDRPRIAGVSAFGMGGTNAHVVVEEAPEEAAPVGGDDVVSSAEPSAVSSIEPSVVPWVLSARSGAGLRGQAAGLLGSVDAADPVDVGWSLLTTRARFEHRAVVLGGYGAGLSALAAGEPAGGVVSGVAGPVGRTVFVFPGQGAQWAGMAVGLLESSPVFAERMRECEVALSAFVDWSLLGVLRGDAGAPSLERVDVVQPASFAVMVSLAALWRSYGVEPAAVVGHSQGEIAAACVAGALSLEDAARVVCLRSRAIARLSGSGGMASVAAPVERVEELLAGWSGRVWVAAVNSGSQVVVSGQADAVGEVVAECERLGVRARRIAVDYASHSPAMDALRDDLSTALTDITPRAGQMPVLSTVTGEFTDGLQMDGGYWFTNLRSRVRFAEAVEKLAAEGFGTFVEVSSHPVTTTAVQEVTDGTEGVVVTGSLRRHDGGLDRFLASAAELWVRGVEVDWTATFQGARPRTVDLPTYPFQRRRHWFDTVAPEPAEGEVGVAAARLAEARDEAERRRVLLELVRAHAAAVLGHTDATTIPARTQFKDAGFDSQSSLRLRNRICEALGVDLSTTVLYDHPTPERLVEHVQARIGGATGPDAKAPVGRPSYDEPIAIVGMGCRFPGGVRSPEDLWELVRSGTDAVSPFPVDRGWDLRRLLADPDAPGGSAVREGGFLHDAGDFDADFFGISPREALAMDPQQRLLLETSWEALERAGIDPSRLGGTGTGVFVGAMHQEYGPRLHEASDGLEGYALTGTTASTASGRISYVLGLEGPAMTVDTACSASLVALHLAVRSLRAGECSLALAGAATVMSTPGIFVEFSRQRGLAPDGRCKAFSDDADGTGWAEGVGTLVLERLSDARRHGHRVLAVVEGTAVNQDGASNGLTAPHGPSQRRVIQQALTSAGLRPDDVDAVEAHGTGTVLGDPIEAQALIDVYGRGRSPERPLWLGSLKSNIGHAQAAAGLGGVMKMVLAMRHGLLPRTLHAETPSSHVDWSSGEVRLLNEPVPWAAGDRRRRAGVSSFGISGTNAHVILAEPPLESAEQAGASDPTGQAGPTHLAEPNEQAGPTVPAPQADATAQAEPALQHGPTGRPLTQPTGSAEQAGDAPTQALPGAADGCAALPYVLSARTPQALREQARRLRGALRAGPAGRTADIAYTLATSRARFAERAVLLADGPAALDEGLAAFAAGGEPAGLVRGRPSGDDRVVFVFPGQGGQWPGMAAGLLDSSPVFAARAAECDRALAEFVDFSLIDVLRGADGAPSLDRVDVVQPALWATMVCLAELWQSQGIRPAAVVGHSQGEIAAACVAGALSLRDGARVVALRSRALLALAGRGTMASVFQSVERVGEIVARYEGRVSVAATNGPRSVVVSGETDAVAEFLAECVELGIDGRAVPVDYASHSAQVEAIEADLARLLAPIEPRRAQVPFHSTLTGTVLEGTELTGDYWYRNLRGTVRFEETVRDLAGSGHRIFLEASPHPTLTIAVQQTLESAGAADGVAIGSLRRGDGGLGRFRESLAQAQVHGVEPDWEQVFAGRDVRRVELPTYPFERQRYWWTPPAMAPAGPAADEHPAAAWRYDVAWHPVPDAPAAELTGRWLVAARDEDVAAATDAAGAAGHREVVEALRGAGARAVLCLLPDELPGPEAITRAVDGQQVTGVLSLLALSGGTEPAARVAGLAALLRALDRAGVDAPLWCATRGAVAVGPSDPAPDAALAALWGAGRAVAVEQPRSWGGLVDLPVRWDARSGDRLAALLAGRQGEDQAAIRPAGLFARRLVPARRPATGPRPYRPHGTVLVTGGTGALGRRLARRLADGGADHVVLLSRGGGDRAATAALADELSGSGCEVTAVACDVTDRTALAAVLARTGQDHRPLTAVFHAAGACELAELKDVRPEDLPALLAAKVEGARHLDELLADTPLDAFVLFSSVSGTWGVAEHGTYGAANAYLDALAQARRSRGGTATSVAWGPWGGGGMIEDSRFASLAATGLPVLDPEQALEALQLVLDHDETAVAVADVDWDRFGPVFTSARPSPLLSGLVTASKDPAGPEAADLPASAFHARLAELPEDAQRDLALDLVREHTAKVLGHGEPQALAADRAFRDLGFDSLTAVELRNRLATATGTQLPTTLVFDHPSPALLAEHLLHQVRGRQPVEAAPPSAGAASDEPLAIVGMACRLPGGIDGPDALWRLLVDGGDVVGPLPGDRGWDVEALYDPDPDRHGTSYARAGGFLDGAADFDHEFFGISAREALAMDPQQRLLLQTSWAAFEHAGIVPADLKGSDTGVFAGVLPPDYGLPHGMPGELEGYHVTGGAPSVVSGRLAYQFGFTGPAVSIDTACSSSLVALHMAARALAAGECRLALVAGVAVMSTPTPLISFSRQRALSADGRCRSFAEDANGFGMAEGVGVLLVEPLSAARRAGHRVLAVVRGSAVNQDGASNGLTAPNGPAQQRVIRQALNRAGLGPDEVDAVEAHGTGTRLGDPIEAQALIATYGTGRPADRPLWLGSAKSNLGHTQSAAGVVGVIKMVQALRHGLLPATLHATEPTSRVDWESGAVRLLAESRPWPKNGRPRRAGVSAFGISGTNAHVILEQAPPLPEVQAPPLPEAGEEHPHRPETSGTEGSPAGARPVVPWLLSARDPEALREQAAALVPLARQADPADVAWSLATTRARFEHRAVVVGGYESGLSALAAGEPAGSVVSGVAGPVGRTVFVFPGQGAQWAGMAVELMAASPVFAERMRECEVALSAFVDWSLLAVLRGDADAPSLERVDVVQPASFAVMVSLAALWRSYGVEPDAVVGHSQGEIAAACVAGALSLEDAARVVCLRSRALTAVTGHGAMAIVALPEDQAGDLLSDHADQVSVAAVNGPGTVVLSGDRAALEAVSRTCRQRGVRMRMIPVDYASHSVHVEKILDELAGLLAPVRPRHPEVPFLSTVTGEWIDTPALDAAYWCANLRRPVRFAEAVRTLAEQGYGCFVESSPHPVLLAAVDDTLADRDDAFAVGSLRRDDGGADRFLLSLAEAWVRGAPVDFGPAVPGGPDRLVELPTYPFRRRRHWLESPAEATARKEAALIDGWRYRIDWTPVSGTGTPSLAGDWIVLTPNEPVRPDLVRAVLKGLARHGATVHPVTARELARGCAPLPEGITGILSLAALDERPGDDDPVVTVGLADTVTCVRELAARAPHVPLWTATSGAVGTTADDPVRRPAQAQVWGLGVVLGLDEPGRVCGLVDLPDELTEDDAARLAESLSGVTGEHEVAVRAGTTLARRLVPDPAPEAEPWRPRGTVLITGGTGGLGSHVARWAARNGAAHLILTSRRGPDAPGADELHTELTALGAARVTVAACDVADRDQLAALLATVDDTAPLSAVVHAAGVTQPAVPVGELSTADLAGVLRAKVEGARNLDALTRHADLDAFVLFSSGAGTWGDAGKAGYAAANAYLDAFAAERRARGAVATSVAWGAWDAGMVDGDVADLLTRRGLRLMRPERAVRALALAVGNGDTTVALASFDLARWVPLYTTDRDRRLVAALAPQTAPGTDGDHAPAPERAAATADRLAGLSAEERETALTDIVRREAAAVLKAGGPDEIRPRRPFKELGFDSLTALEFRNRLAAATGRRLPATLVFDHPTPATLVRHLSGGTADGGNDVSADLDRLEARLAALPDEERTRLGLADRLRALLRRLEPAAEDTADPQDDLTAASNDEIFDLIDRELGIG
ncbi:SDR family NAD(P)-dependent oxidoreductase [Streptomyces albus]|uniref:SDR family NAD(P)-dependent oxidoreductase n=1 Tax=Streptomyces albus TaxID=1888 RepID=UPI0033FF962C